MTQDLSSDCINVSWDRFGIVDAIEEDRNLKIVLDREKKDFQPKLSLIVPAFEVANCVSETLCSLLEASVGFPLELLVIDDGSSDETLSKILEVLEPRDCVNFRVLSQANRGLSRVRNLGARLSRGEWIAFLDSDDWITRSGFEAMAKACDDPSIDLLFGGCEIFSGKGHSRPFYHEAIWQRLLEGKEKITISSLQSPEVFSLEPNVNYRWIRRSFYLENQLYFPEGLFFEDVAVHIRMIARARRIALLAPCYYRYRIFRPGKITEERGQRRFDALKTLRMALDEMHMANLVIPQAVAALRVIDRIAWGCGTMTLPRQRWRYFWDLKGVLSQIPWRWRLAFLKSSVNNPRQFLMGCLLAPRSAGILTVVSIFRDLWVFFRR